MRENHAWFVIRGIPLAILDPPSPPSPPPLLLLLLLLPLFPRVPSGPETPCFFTGLWDFFHADRRVVHQRRLTEVFLSFGFLLISLLHRVRAFLSFFLSFFPSFFWECAFRFLLGGFLSVSALRSRLKGSCCCTAMEKERGDEE